MDAVVDRVYTSNTGAGLTIILKIINKNEFWNKRNKDYQLIYKSKGEKEKGKTFSPDLPIYLIYMHLSKTSVKEGQLVFAGDIIGKSGNTGKRGQVMKRANPHLHFAVSNAFKYDESHNPMYWFEPKHYNSSTNNLTKDDIDLQEKARNEYKK